MTKFFGTQELKAEQLPGLDEPVYIRAKRMWSLKAADLRRRDQIGYEAWAAQMPDRADVMFRTFNPGDPEKARRDLRSYRKYGRSAIYLTAHIGSPDNEAVAFLTARNDVSAHTHQGNRRWMNRFDWAEKFGKRALAPVARFLGNIAIPGNVGVMNTAQDFLRRKDKVYAKIEDVSVLPDYQGHKIGSLLVRASADYFSPRQKPTAYVFEENPRVRTWFRDKLGFAKEDGPDPRQSVRYRYFGNELNGEAVEPVLQYREQSPSVIDMNQRLVRDMPGVSVEYLPAA
jgi:GNAT superfamily N-acetyltransferase